MYPSPTSLRVPGETLGPVWAAASSASHSFLEVLLGTRRIGASFGGLFPVGAAMADHPRFVELPLLAFVSSSFSFGLVVLLAPAIYVSVLVAL